MSNEKRFSYFLVAALAASFSAGDAQAEAQPDTLELDREGEWRPVAPDALEQTSTSMIETSSGWGVEIDRVRFHGEGFDVELQTRGRLDDLQIRLQPGEEETSGDAMAVAEWLDDYMNPGDRLYRQADEWSFVGRLYAPGVDGRPGERSIAVEGALPLDIDVAKEDAVVEVNISVPESIFEVDWQTFRDRLKLEA